MARSFSASSYRTKTRNDGFQTEYDVRHIGTRYHLVNVESTLVPSCVRNSTKCTQLECLGPRHTNPKRKGVRAKSIHSIDNIAPTRVQSACAQDLQNPSLIAYLVKDHEEEIEPAEERIWEANVFLAAA